MKTKKPELIYKENKKPTLTFIVSSNKKTSRIITLGVFDNRTQEYWTTEHIISRGVSHFNDMDDMKDTINWCVNGDSTEYYVKKGPSRGLCTSWYVYVFD